MSQILISYTTFHAGWVISSPEPPNPVLPAAILDRLSENEIRNRIDVLSRSLVVKRNAVCTVFVYIGLLLFVASIAAFFFIPLALVTGIAGVVVAIAASVFSHYDHHRKLGRFEDSVAHVLKSFNQADKPKGLAWAMNGVNESWKLTANNGFIRSDLTARQWIVALTLSD